jgi:hypothetical protein
MSLKESLRKQVINRCMIDTHTHTQAVVRSTDRPSLLFCGIIAYSPFRGLSWPCSGLLLSSIDQISYVSIKALIPCVHTTLSNEHGDLKTNVSVCICVYGWVQIMMNERRGYGCGFGIIRRIIDTIFCSSRRRITTVSLRSSYRSHID